MSLGERKIIQKYFSDVGSAYLAEQGIRVSVGDDAAIISNPHDKESVVSIDTSIEGIHFLSSMKAKDIAYRSVAIALSDLAACGATPAWYTLALSMESNDEDWLKEFSEGLRIVSDEFRLPLVGGDTTKGALSISVQVTGYCDPGKAITRKGSLKGDLVFVSGFIGEAARELKSLREGEENKNENLTYLRPKARIDLGQRLIGIASAAIDVSDGLIQDLGNICRASNLGCEILLENIPTKLSRPLTANEINQGDDYEICFSADESNLEEISSISKELGIKITAIGRMTEGNLVKVINKEGLEVKIKSGFEHF
ncbi:MAG: thiamine-phosphate kinase [Gammaproteobacteria bacterium]